jgi:AcrR family transcriptional regulator
MAHPGLRERKKDNTRQAIYDAAFRLVRARGPAGVTVEQISASADVSPRTFFNYFSSKEEAIVGLDVRRVGELRGALSARPPSEAPLTALHAAITGALPPTGGGAAGGASEDFARGASDWDARMNLIRDYPALFPHYVAAFARLESALAAAIEEREGISPGSEIYPQLVVGAGLTAFRLAIARWQTPGEERPLTAIVAEAFEQLGTGLRRPPRPARPAS